MNKCLLPATLVPACLLQISLGNAQNSVPNSRVTHRTNHGRLAAILLIFSSLHVCYGQGTMTVTFDGPPAFLSGDLFWRYQESGMSIIATTNQQGYGGFSRIGPSFPDSAYNGTSYIRTWTSYLEVTSLSGSPFGLSSVDLAEYNHTVPNPVTVQFVGYRADGSTVTTSFTSDGIIGLPTTPDFQTFYFGPEFNNLIRLEIPPVQASLDNLVFSIPEPATGSLMIVGGALVVFRLSRRSRDLLQL